MNREIKFRKWHIYLKRMAYSDQDISLYGFFKLVKLCPNYYKITEYTGLKDKKGKDIYEGDILKMRLPHNYGFAGVQYEDHIALIVKEPGCFWFEAKGYRDCNWHHYSAKDREVIGNIYENPELL